MGGGQTDSICRGTVVPAHHGCRGNVYLGHLPICANELRAETEKVAGGVRGETGSSKGSPVVRKAVTIRWPMSLIQLLVRADRVGGPQREGDCDIACAGP
jgi:hypothetical protein